MSSKFKKAAPLPTKRVILLHLKRSWPSVGYPWSQYLNATISGCRKTFGRKKDKRPSQMSPMPNIYSNTHTFSNILILKKYSDNYDGIICT